MYIEIDNASIYVNVTGQGEDALLLHGVPDSADLWNKVIDGVKHQFTCHAPDLPGFHRSGMPDSFEFNFDHYADYVDQVVTKLQLKTPLTLVMHDWGGIFGMLWASKYPHKVKRIIGGDFPFSPAYKWHEWARIWQTPVIGEIAMLSINWPLFKWEFQRSSKRLDIDEIRSVYSGKVQKKLVKKTILKLYRSADPKHFEPWLIKQQELAKQTSIDLIWGADDPYVPVDEGKLLNASSIKVVPNCGHWPPTETPDEYINLLLKNSNKDS